MIYLLLPGQFPAVCVSVRTHLDKELLWLDCLHNISMSSKSYLEMARKSVWWSVSCLSKLHDRFPAQVLALLLSYHDVISVSRPKASKSQMWYITEEWVPLALNSVFQIALYLKGLLIYKVDCCGYIWKEQGGRIWRTTLPMRIFFFNNSQCSDGPWALGVAQNDWHWLLISRTSSGKLED